MTDLSDQFDTDAALDDDAAARRANDARGNTIASMHNLLYFLTDHPEVKLPSFGLTVYHFGFEADKTELLSSYARGFGTFEKSVSDDYFSIQKDFGYSVSFRATFHREQVCTPRVVGTRTVTKLVYPKSVEPAEIEVDEDILEWDCPSLLGGGHNGPSE